MSSSPFETDAAFWVMCLGTFLAIQATAVYFGAKIIKKNGERLQQKITLTFESMSETDACEMPLNGLAQELVARGNASLGLVARFTEYHYIAIISALASGTLGGVAAFLISSFGWGKSNEALQGFFVGCAASLSFWLTAIQVFKYPETIAKHESIYSSCANLLSELRLAVYMPPKEDERGKPFQLCDFVQRFAKRVESVRSIGVAFDGSKIGFSRIDAPK